MLQSSKVICVSFFQAKAYTTRVGAGPYPTEIHGDLATSLREAGGEYGTTTGRPRRVGWLDIPCLKYAARQEISICTEPAKSSQASRVRLSK